MSAVSLYYYFRIVVQMYLREDGEGSGPGGAGARPLGRGDDRASARVVTLVIGVWPAPVVEWAQSGLQRPRACECGGRSERALPPDPDDLPCERLGMRCHSTARGVHGDSDAVADSRKTLRNASTWLNVSIVGIQFPVAIAIGFFWGKWLDRHLGTWPWLTGLFSLFGIAAGFVNLFRITAKAADGRGAGAEVPRSDGEEDPPRTAARHPKG